MLLVLDLKSLPRDEEVAELAAAVAVGVAAVEVEVVLVAAAEVAAVRARQAGVIT